MVLWAFRLCCGSFGLCCESSRLYCEHLVCAVGYLILMWCFCCRCNQFVISVSNLLLLWQLWATVPHYWKYSPHVLLLPPQYWRYQSTVLNTLHSTDVIPTVLMLSPTVLSNLHSTEAIPHSSDAIPPMYWTVSNVLNNPPLYWTDIIWSECCANWKRVERVEMGLEGWEVRRGSEARRGWTKDGLGRHSSSISCEVFTF